MSHLTDANSLPASRKPLKNARPVFLPWRRWWTKLCTNLKPAGGKFLPQPSERKCSKNCAGLMKWRNYVTRRCTNDLRMSINLWMPSILSAGEETQLLSSGNCFRPRQRKLNRVPLARDHAVSQTKIMVAFKEEFPYLRTESGQLFEFNRDWLHAAI